MGSMGTVLVLPLNVKRSTRTVPMLPELCDSCRKSELTKNLKTKEGNKESLKNSNSGY
jgi:hypothetical protein